MRIAILGWGSLIKDPRNLRYKGNWQEGGPTLPIEFSRVSKGGRLTLVIDMDNGVDVTTRFVESEFEDLDSTIENLKEREGTSTRNIGFLEIESQENRTRNNEILHQIRSFAREHGFDAVIWTDLPPKFQEELNVPFTVDEAIDYLTNLSNEEKSKARDYIRKAPEEVLTPLRKKLDEIGWLNEVE